MPALFRTAEHLSAVRGSRAVRRCPGVKFWIKMQSERNDHGSKTAISDFIRGGESQHGHFAE